VNVYISVIQWHGRVQAIYQIIVLFYVWCVVLNVYIYIYIYIKLLHQTGHRLLNFVSPSIFCAVALRFDRSHEGACYAAASVSSQCVFYWVITKISVQKHWNFVILLFCVLFLLIVLCFSFIQFYCVCAFVLGLLLSFLSLSWHVNKHPFIIIINIIIISIVVIIHYILLDSHCSTVVLLYPLIQYPRFTTARKNIRN
jgi:hypothetical protein